MKMIEISALSNGAHRNQTFNGVLPNGWALDRLDLCKENFPFGEVTVEEVDGLMTVLAWTPLPIPEEPEVEPEPSQLDRIEAQVTYTAMMTDTLLEV